MMTAEEIASQFAEVSINGFGYLGIRNSIIAIRKAQTEAWNEAIEAAAKSAEVSNEFTQYGWEMKVSQESILKLKK